MRRPFIYCDSFSMWCQFLFNGVGKSSRSDVIGRSFHEHPCQVLAFCIKDSFLPPGVSTENNYTQLNKILRLSEFATQFVKAFPSPTFHEAALLLWSSSWIWAGRTETSPERRLQLLTGRLHSRPPPHGSPPGPAVTGSRLNTCRKKHTDFNQLGQILPCSRCWRRAGVMHLTWHCLSDVLLAGVPVLCPTHSYTVLTQPYYCDTGKVLKKTQNRCNYSDVVMLCILYLMSHFVTSWSP